MNLRNKKNKKLLIHLSTINIRYLYCILIDRKRVQKEVIFISLFDENCIQKLIRFISFP